MLKLQYRDSARSVWLVGPVMTIGSARDNDIIVSDGAVAATHGKLHISEDKMEYEACDNNEAFINETPVSGTQSIVLGDVLRVGTNEFVIVDPKERATTASPLKRMNASKGSEDTVFRMSAADAKEQAVQASGWMLQAMHPSLKNKRYPVDGTMYLGRSQDCALCFSYDRLSRKHAELKVIDNVLMIKDLGSSNGTFHNGERVTQAKLHPGDTVAFDKLEFTVIGPSTAAQSEQLDAGNLSQTVVRAAITPEMIKQASKAAQKPQSQMAASQDYDEPAAMPKEGRGMSTVMLVTALVIVAGLVGAYFML